MLRDLNSDERSLRRAALIAVVTHLIAGAAMAIVLRNGLETNPDVRSRLEFIADHRLTWIAGWLTWNIAALSIAWFFINFHATHSSYDDAPLLGLRAALVLGLIGLAPDLSAESIEMGVLPGIAQQALSELTNLADELRRFQVLHRVSVMLTGYLANTLYTLAVIVNVLTVWKRYPLWLNVVGLAVGVCGLAASAASLLDSVDGLFWTNALLVPCLLVWLAGIGLTTTSKPDA